MPGSRNLFLVSFIVCAGILAGVHPVSAQGWPDELALRQLFRVKVDGTNRAGQLIQSIEGTAFAIAPDMLLTAGHNVGKAEVFLNASNTDVLFVPDRKLTVIFPDSKESNKDREEKFDSRVTESPIASVDAARIGLVGWSAVPFPLSACDIEFGQEYHVFKFLRSGSSVDIWKPVKVRLTQKQFGTSQLGDGNSVVVMTAAETGAPAIVSGDSGSPMLTSDGKVIGIVTNVDGGDVHVTLIHAALDLVPWSFGKKSLNDIECSVRKLPQTVEDLTQEITTLQTQNRTFRSEIDNLTRRQTELGREIARLNAIAGSAISSLANVRELMDVELSDDEITAKIQKELAKGRPPLIDGVRGIYDDLGTPNWEFSGEPEDEGSIKLTLSYTRDLSLEPYSQKLFFCFQPMIPKSDDAVVAKKDLPDHGRFYSWRDEQVSDPNYIGACTDVKIDTSGKQKARDGRYVMKIPSQWYQTLQNDFATSSEKPDIEDWGGRYYLQIVNFQEASEADQPDAEIVLRAVIDVKKDGDDTYPDGAFPCQYVPARSYSGIVKYALGGEQELPVGEKCYPTDSSL
jgi:hypothetical protein